MFWFRSNGAATYGGCYGSIGGTVDVLNAQKKDSAMTIAIATSTTVISIASRFFRMLGSGSSTSSSDECFRADMKLLFMMRNR